MTLPHCRAKTTDTKGQLSDLPKARHLAFGQSGIQTQALPWKACVPVPMHSAAFQGDSWEESNADAARPSPGCADVNPHSFS